MKALRYHFLLACLLSTAFAATPPNIVFILADDLGITDVNAYARHFTGAENSNLFYETPNIDRLVADGIAFSQAYSNQLCTPTRAAILSGRIASTLGVTTATPPTRTWFNQGLPVPEGGHPHDAFAHKDQIKIPQAWINGHSNTALDPTLDTLPKVLKNHHSAFLGKWHLGGHGAAAVQPAAHGFTEIAYADMGGSTYFDWAKVWDERKSPFPKMPGKYRIGKAGAPTDRSYLTDDLSLRACDFIRSRAGNKEPFLLYYCPFAVHTPIVAPEETVAHFKAKPQLGHLGHGNATYAAMLKHLDDSIGEVRKTLEETGIAENTLIVFTSDNGGVEYTAPAATDNQPFTGGKACLYEGGIRVPSIWYLPGRFEGGKWCDQVADCTDFLPTLAAITGNTAPDGIDGRNILPLLEDPAAKAAPRTLFWHYPFNVIVIDPKHGTPLAPHSAIREGDMKLIWNWHGKLSLYDIAADPFETKDLATGKADLTKQLHGKLKAWLRENVGDLYWPQPAPGYDPKAPGTAFPFADLR
ncbi:sulfatase [Akkermansiaceae bacterium]|nr:sulfatase [Akkermansiaceae bacterium]